MCQMLSKGLNSNERQQRELTFCGPYFVPDTVLNFPCARYATSLQSCLTFSALRTVALQAPLSFGILWARILEWVAISFSYLTSQHYALDIIISLSSLKKKDLFLEQFQAHRNLKREHRVFPYTSLISHVHSLPHYQWPVWQVYICNN